HKTAWLLGGMVALFVLIHGGRTAAGRVRSARRERELLGTTADRAITVGAPGDVEDRLKVMGCACGTAAWSGAERATVTYEGRPMTVVSRTCGACRREQTLYFRLADRGFEAGGR